MRALRNVVFISLFLVMLGFGSTAFAGQLSFTDFEGFITGISVDGQGNWKVDTNVGFDERVVDDTTGNIVWRVSNAVTSEAFGNQPFAPCPGGIPADGIDANNSIDGGNLEAVAGDPDSFAGETSTGAALRRFYAEFNFKSATGSAQPGLRVTVSADDCEGARHSFIALEDDGHGIHVITFDNNRAGHFPGPITIAQGLSYTEWHTFAVEVIFRDGEANDIVRYYVDGKFVQQGGSWEQFYRNFQADLHPDGVPAQTLLFRLSPPAVLDVSGGGYFIDNVLTMVSHSLDLPQEPGRK